MFHEGGNFPCSTIKRLDWNSKAFPRRPQDQLRSFWGFGWGGGGALPLIPCRSITKSFGAASLKLKLNRRVVALELKTKGEFPWASDSAVNLGETIPEKDYHHKSPYTRNAKVDPGWAQKVHMKRERGQNL